MTDKTIQVVALVVDPDNLTFYKVDGAVYVVTQGDPRGPTMADAFFEARKRGEDVITLAVGADDKIATSHFDNGKRNPLVRFFRALKKDVAKLLGTDKEVEENELTDDHEAAACRVKALAEKLMERTENTEQADDLPVRMVNSEDPIGKDETIIAVTKDGIVPEVENLNDQFVAADEGKAPAGGAEQLILRVSKLGGLRRHSAADLMKFLKGVDLPILSDGSFLVYKRLRHIGNGVYVDPHTSRVHQRVGDIVEMDESMVDPDRRRDCSNGLHVGSRSYMGGFATGGDAGTMLVLVQPEDAIAVPEYAANKMRACRYEIIADLSNKAQDLINSNKRVDACSTTMDLIAAIVAGARPQKLGVVKIGGANGHNLTYTLNGQSIPTNTPLEEAKAISQGKATAPKTAVTPVRTIDDKKNGSPVIPKPEKVRDKVHKVTPKAAQAKASPLSPRQQEAQALRRTMDDTTNNHVSRRQAAEKLKAFKASKKVSYESLGLPKNMGELIENFLKQPAPASPKAAPKPSAPVPSVKKPEPAKTAPQPKAPVKADAPKGESRQDKARRLYGNMTDPKRSGPARKSAAEDLQALKRAAKVGWGSLGLGDKNVEADIKKAIS